MIDKKNEVMYKKIEEVDRIYNETLLLIKGEEPLAVVGARSTVLVDLMIAYFPDNSESLLKGLFDKILKSVQNMPRDKEKL